MNGMELALHTADLTPVALVIPDTLTDYQVSQIGESLAKIDGCLGWWMGDYFLELRRRGSTVTIEEFAAARELSAHTIYFYRNTCEFFPVHARNNRLTWSHHHVTINALPSAHRELATASDWLDKAVENGWSVAELKRQIRAAYADKAPKTADKTSAGWSTLLDADRWSAAQLAGIPAMPTDAAIALLGDIPNLIQLIEALREKAEDDAAGDGAGVDEDVKPKRKAKAKSSVQK
jgi:hypothetical protein